jgi:hypothetical protein
MKKLIASLMIIGFLASCQRPNDSGVFIETSDTVTINNNNGGNLVAFMKERSDLKASGKKVIISGYCASACTIFYSLPNVCMAKGSSLLFHGAKGMIDLADDIGNALLSTHYYAGIKTSFNNDWYTYSTPLKVVTREEAKVLDPAINFCEDL